MAGLEHEVLMAPIDDDRHIIRGDDPVAGDDVPEGRVWDLQVDAVTRLQRVDVCKGRAKGRPMTRDVYEVAPPGKTAALVQSRASMERGRIRPFDEHRAQRESRDDDLPDRVTGTQCASIRSSR